VTETSDNAPFEPIQKNFKTPLTIGRISGILLKHAMSKYACCAMKREIAGGHFLVTSVEYVRYPLYAGKQSGG
jgi:hypothetical protein